MTKSSAISGSVKPGFEAVREAFVQNFERRNELGAACCIYYRGEKVVDLWGGVRNEATGEPWEEDTMVIVFSTTKGLAGLAMALAHSQGLFDYDERISRYWPEFAQQGKDKITIRQLLAHQAGLFAFDELGDKSTVTDLDRLGAVLARQKPAHEPGTRQVYHALTLGYYESELLRRVHPKGRSIGQYFQDEIATPLGIDFYIRLPEEIPNTRLATIRQQRMGVSAMLKLPIPFLLAVMNPGSAIRRALVGSLFPLDKERVYARNFEVPSGASFNLRAFITVARHTGMRAGELLKLYWDDVNFEEEQIYIRDTKNFTQRTVPINGVVLEILSKIPKDNNRVFKYMNKDTIGNTWRNVLKRTKISGYRVHDMRHTFITDLVTKGVDITTIMEITGHKDIRMLKRYSHPTEEHKKNAVKLLESLSNNHITITQEAKAVEISNDIGRLSR